MKTAVENEQDVQDGERTATLIRLRHADCLVTLGQVASRVAHDVGTPLAVIAGRSSMIANGQLQGDDVKRSGAIIAEQAERIREVLQRLIELTRWQGTAFDRRGVAELVDEATTVLSPLARANNVEVEIEHADTALLPKADGRHVLQVLTNLMAYAIEGADAGSRVQIRVEHFVVAKGRDPRIPPGPHLRVQICHAPAGKDEATPPQVFDLYYVAQVEFVSEYFGIAISEAIVRSYGGRLTFERTSDGGHCSAFHLPIDP